MKNDYLEGGLSSNVERGQDENKKNALIFLSCFLKAELTGERSSAHLVKEEGGKRSPDVRLEKVEEKVLNEVANFMSLLESFFGKDWQDLVLSSKLDSIIMEDSSFKDKIPSLVERMLEIDNKLNRLMDEGVSSDGYKIIQLLKNLIFTILLLEHLISLNHSFPETN